MFSRTRTSFFLTSTPLACRSNSRSILAAIAVLGLALPVLFASTNSAMALSQEQALETCRETVGRPIVQACMQGMRGGGGGDREANLTKCRGGAAPKVKACMMAALNKANGRANVAVEIGKPKEEVIAPGTALPAGFVAPPRTIADITAILDSEKPDPATLAKLKEDADDEPDTRMSKADLVEFYYDRANARVLLGRNKEAVADAEKALPIARSAADPMVSFAYGNFSEFRSRPGAT